MGRYFSSLELARLRAEFLRDLVASVNGIVLKPGTVSANSLSPDDPLPDGLERDPVALPVANASLVLAEEAAAVSAAASALVGALETRLELGETAWNQASVDATHYRNSGIYPPPDTTFSGTLVVDAGSSMPGEYTLVFVNGILVSATHTPYES